MFHNSLYTAFPLLSMQTKFGFLLLVVVALSLGSIPAVSATPVNGTLFVSAENSMFDNHFVGSMVIEVIIVDQDSTPLNQNLEEPDVTINGDQLRMVQANDSNWYGYFAEVDVVKIADSTVGLPGFGLDYGEFCSSISNVAGIDLTETAAFAIARDIPTGSNGLEPFGVCTDIVSASDPLVNHVVRESKAVNQKADLDGQIGIDVDVWPLIQLYDLNPTGSVTIDYNKDGDAQTTALTFDSVEQFAEIDLDTSYPNNAEVDVTITDIQLNIDPTDADSWTFGTNQSNPMTIYQVFDENGMIDSDGTAGAVDIFPIRDQLMFTLNGVLLLDVDAQSVGIDVVNLQDNDNQEIIAGDSAEDAVSLGGTFGPGTQPITITETQSNSGIFTTFDESGKSNIITTPDAQIGTTAIIDYSEFPFHILIIEPLFCNDMTIDELIASGNYNVIDNRDGSLGILLVGTQHDDLILASDDGDVILANRGDDCIIGGAGADTVYGFKGDDQIFGQAGDDLLDGGVDADIIHGGDGNDTIDGGHGDDVLSGDGGKDRINGDRGDDTIFGGDDDDVLVDFGGEDSLDGEYGFDVCIDPRNTSNPFVNCEITYP